MNKRCSSLFGGVGKISSRLIVDEVGACDVVLSLVYVGVCGTVHDYVGFRFLHFGTFGVNVGDVKFCHVGKRVVVAAFSGDAAQPVWEYDLPAPRSVYGKTQLLGEQYVQQFCTHYFIVRTAWLYGYAGNNFVKTILRLARQNGGVTVVDDQLGNPTNAADLAHEILNLLVTKEYGVYHCTGEGVCSWCEFAAEIIRLSGIPATVTPCTTEQFIAGAKKQIAPRPAYSALENAMLKATIGNEMRDWKTALACFFENYKPEE